MEKQSSLKKAFYIIFLGIVGMFLLFEAIEKVVFPFIIGLSHDANGWIAVLVFSAILIFGGIIWRLVRKAECKR